MPNLQARKDIKVESKKKRMKIIKFADPVTNIGAGNENPMRLLFFVNYRAREHIVSCTDGKGNFGDFNADVIHSQHLDYVKCKKLYAPVWQAEYGR